MDRALTLLPDNAQRSILEANHLRRTADDGTLLLDDVSLRVDEGDAIAIVGPPGAGKTLLLRAVAMLDPLDGGEVRFLGRPVAADAVPAFRRKVLYVQQRSALVEGTVRENLQLPFSFESAGSDSFDEKRVEQWLEAMGRSGRFLDRSVDDLSGGESQIVSLLRAMQLDPAVLLLDEPTSSLDDPTRRQVESLLRDWLQHPGTGEVPAALHPRATATTSARREARPPVSRTTARCLVIITHDEAQAERLCDRRVRLAGGRVVEKESQEHPQEYPRGQDA